MIGKAKDKQECGSAARSGESMTRYEQIDTIGHIKRIDVLGDDPLSGNIVIELHCGNRQTDQIKRFGAFSISPDALERFLRQVEYELADTAATTTHSA